MIKPFISFCALLFVLISCTSNQPAKQSKQIILSAPDKPSIAGYFKDHFEIAEVIPIETSDDLLISNIRKVIRHNDRIFLLSGRDAVFVIDAKTGEIQTSINRIGAGPGESKSIIDIAFDESSEQILIYNDYSRLLYFDLSGTFLSEKKIDDELYEGLNIYGNKVIFHSKSEGYSCYPYLFKVSETGDSNWQQVGHNEKVDFSIRSPGRQTAVSKRLWFTAPLDFGLHYIDAHQIKSPYEIHFPNSLVSKELAKEANTNPEKFFTEVVNNDLIYSVNSVRETADYLVFRTNQEGIFVVNKNENTVYWDSYVDEGTLGIKLTHYFPHDGDDDKIMFILPANVYTQYAQPDAGNGGTTLPKVNEDDNPILIFYKQKVDR